MAVGDPGLSSFGHGFMARKLSLVFKLTVIFLSGLGGLSPAVSNSATVSHAVFEAVWEERSLFFSLCLAPRLAAVCQLDADEKTLLQKIVTSLPQESGGLIFDSESTHPQRFQLQGEAVPRTAVTGSRVGDAIYLNEKRLFEEDATGGHHPFLPYAAASLLLHELAHHHGLRGSAEEEHQAIENFSAKYEQGLRSGSFELDLSLYQQPQIKVFAMNAWSKRAGLKNFPLIWIQDDHSFEAFDSLVPQTLLCDSTQLKPSGFWLKSLYWSTDRQVTPEKRLGVFLDGNGEAQCGNPPLSSASLLLLGAQIAPDSPTAEPEWWKTSLGHLIRESSTASAGRPHSSVENLLTLTVERSTPRTLKDGGDWAVAAILESEKAITPKKCVGLLMSQFYRAEINLEDFLFDGCELQRIDDRHFRVLLKHQFLPATTARTYKLGQIEVYLEGKDQAYFVVPNIKPQIQVISSEKPKLIRLAQLHPYSAGRPLQADPRCKHWFEFQRGDGLDLRLKIHSSSIPIEAAFYFDFFRKDGSEGSMSLDFLTRFEVKPWLISRLLLPLEGDWWGLQGQLAFPANPYEIKAIRLRELVITNREYEQIRGRIDPMPEFLIVD